MKDKCDFPAFTSYRLPDGIIHIDLKKVKKLGAQDIKDMFDCFEKGGSKTGAYVLVTFNGFIPLSEDAMAEAKIQGKKNLQAATAYVVGNSAIRVGVNFFMNFYKPGYPILITKTKEEGIVQLNDLKKKSKNKFLST